MRVRVAEDHIDIMDTLVLTSLSVTSDLEAEATRSALKADGLAGADQGAASPGHVWLDVAELARRSAPAADDEWREQFARMIDYAASKGWTDPGRTRVRAHLESSS